MKTATPYAKDILQEVKSALPQYEVIRTGIRCLEIQDPSVRGFSVSRNKGRLEINATGFLFISPENGVYKPSKAKFFPRLEEVFAALQGKN